MITKYEKLCNNWRSNTWAKWWSILKCWKEYLWAGRWTTKVTSCYNVKPLRKLQERGLLATTWHKDNSNSLPKNIIPSYCFQLGSELLSDTIQTSIRCGCGSKECLNGFSYYYTGELCKTAMKKYLPYEDNVKEIKLSQCCWTICSHQNQKDLFTI